MPSRLAEILVSCPEDIRLLKRRGVQAVLVGTAIMRSPDPLIKAAELVSVGQFLG